MASEPDGTRGLLVDWGGVMTTNLFTSFASFCEGERLQAQALVHQLRDDEQSRSLVIALETGELDEGEFERAFAERLGVSADGLVDRLFAGSAPDPDMQTAVLRARRSGIATGLLSNSWGTRRYPRERLTELFDAVTISGDVGLRKPAPEIYALAARRIGVAAERCVFVDDIPANLEPAARLGMSTVHHRASAHTIAELERLLHVRLR
ncbi:MAG: putative hydrolase of the superfamily [Solirubrobacteraceae bacterium]|jgi:epoxide hydrolase-like predicted phosphatase|nr:putative hydrolase of the superfamily [Solirubrobacteraceae bacterium]